MEDDFWWKTNFGGRRPSVEDNLQRKTTFAGSLHAAYSALRHFFDTHNIHIYVTDTRKKKHIGAALRQKNSVTPEGL